MEVPGHDELVAHATTAHALVADLDLDERLARADAARTALAGEHDVLVEAALRESGQTVRFARREVESALLFAAALPQLADAIRPRDVPARTGRTRLEWHPYGVAFGWHAANSPIWVPTLVALSALVAGNSVICRPSRRTADTSGHVLRTLATAWPANAIQILDSADPGESEGLITHPGIGVVVTHGSTETCRRQLTRLAGAYATGTRFRPYIPEASGNDPALVLAGADLEQAAQSIAVAAFLNAGQLCMSAKRIIVESRVWSEFRPLLVAAVERLRVGDPAREDTDIPPIGESPGLGRARTALAEALALGGEVVAGRGVDGPFFTPTIVLLPRAATATMLWSEESFAPLRGVMLAADTADAVALANDDAHGLGASIFGPLDSPVGNLRAARVVVNEDPLYQDPHFVVGGVGDSGFFGARPKVEQLVYARRVHYGDGG